MPIAPPEVSRVSFDPIFVTYDDLEDLSTFTGMTIEECRDRLQSYSMQEHSDAWRRANPRTPEEILDFYRSTDLYVWELMQWHASVDRLPYWEALKTFVQRFPPRAGYRRVLDFGCGVGTDGLYLASHGYDVTLVDVDGPAFRFAKHRFARRGLHATFRESRSIVPEVAAEYDVVLCLDVFEHLPDPLEAVQRLVGALRDQGILLQEAAFDAGDSRPCHLAEGRRRFGGLRWGVELAALGLRSDAPLLYRKTAGWERMVQRMRYAVWARTGVWVSRVVREPASP